MPPIRASKASISSRRMERPGLTLIETLAVIVITSMVTGTIGLSLSGSTRASRLHAAMARAIDLDRQARLAALGEGAVRLEVVGGGTGLRMAVAGRDAMLAEHAFDDSIRTMFATVDGQAIGRIAIDARGRSVDYVITVKDIDPEDPNALRSRICGLTGWIVREGDS